VSISKARSNIKRWRKDPVAFVRDNFNVTPDDWQYDALMALTETGTSRRRLVMKACTGPGKSTVLAWAGWWRLSCFAEPNEHPKGAALSGEGRDNLRDNLWSELAKWQNRSAYLKSAFTWTKELIYANDHYETWFLSARSYAKDADLEAIGQSLSGLHSLFPFLLLDETGKMPVAVGQKAEQIFTGVIRDGLIIQAGNPTSTDGLLYHSSTIGADQYHVVTITADPDDPRRTPRVDIEHAREQIKKYGRDNPWVMATILGQFPPSSINVLLGLEEVEASMGRHLTEDKYSFSQKRLGIDVARFGDDRTVIFPRQGLAAFMPIEMRNARTNDISARVAAAKVKWGSEMEFVDGTGGYGSGVIDFLMQAGHSPQEIHFSGKAIDSRYFNKRSEMWFEMAEWVKRGGALPNIPSLLKELTAPTYTFQNGKFRVEEKDQIKKRLQFSPDLADALGLTFALPDMPASNSIQGIKQARQGNKASSDWDPFSERSP
jgi:hypothetical protein